jgi:hypothetical protein
VAFVSIIRDMPRPEFNFREFEERRDLTAAEQGNLRALNRLVNRLGPLGDVVKALLPPGDTIPERAVIRKLARQIRRLKPDLWSEGEGWPAPPQIPGGPRRLRGLRAQPEQQPETLGARPLRSAPRRKLFGFKGDPDAPEYRGLMIKVQSSNVHSIGFEWNDANPSKGTLLVRYLHREKGGSAEAGARYSYHGTHPSLFDSMRKADSKGKFVWDRLRVRGTVSGHRYHYALDQIHRTGYVPRQAVRYGNREYFVGRSINATNTKTGRSRTFTSGHPDAFARQVKSVQILPGGRRIPLVQR